MTRSRPSDEIAIFGERPESDASSQLVETIKVIYVEGLPISAKLGAESLGPPFADSYPVFEVGEVLWTHLVLWLGGHECEASALEIEIGVLDEEPRGVFGRLADPRFRRPTDLCDDRAHPRLVPTIDLLVKRTRRFRGRAPHLLILRRQPDDLARYLGEALGLRAGHATRFPAA